MEVVYWVVGIVFEYVEDFFCGDCVGDGCIIGCNIFCYGDEIWFDVELLIFELGF